MTYCSLAKELMGIKNSTHPLKYSIFTQQSQRLQNHTRSFLSQKSLNLIKIKIQTQITMLILIKSKQKKQKNKKKKQTNKQSKANLTHLSHYGEEDEWWWRGRVIHR